MYMYTYMYMNITVWITNQNLERLSAEANKGGLINRLLAEYYRIQGPSENNLPPVETFPDGSHGFAIPFKKNRLAEPKDKWQEAGVKPFEPVKPACCSQEKLCKHWVWSMDQGTNINSITGEVRE